ncbi:hypothetical protein KFL_000560230 [Klebsormidium nitens]|uniref:SMP domain-containing protein n=1 Tax=Klebsormidium nitens TaxID=105231 RepID=A0A1Y1HR18_KLENI|nr:hypothetical protein KFL_000560230 [Klebsormidium nitens]|eukprot:GAQ80533.1 hypothetical protein KFL_000560230 [Klebsormidium nitens]
MASEQASQERRQAAAAARAHPASPLQDDPAQFEIREQGLCWELRGERAPARASGERQQDEDDARARFLEHRARARREGRAAAAPEPRSPRKGEPSLSEELHREFERRGEDSVTIGEALEAAGRARADKPVDPGDASAIQSAVTRATAGVPISNDLVAEAERAADENERKKLGKVDGTVAYEGNPHTLGDILRNATRRLPMDKPATTDDARRVQSAEERNDPDHVTLARGVSAHVQEAATFNERAQRVAADEPRYPRGYKPGLEDPVLIGEALELAGHERAEKPIGPGDARAVQAAVTRATGYRTGGPLVLKKQLLTDITLSFPKRLTTSDARNRRPLWRGVATAAAVTRATGDRTGGSLGAEAQLLAALNLRDERKGAQKEARKRSQEKILGPLGALPARGNEPGPSEGGGTPVEAHTLGPLLQHAAEALSADKAVTHEDARKVTKAEARGDPEHHNERRGVAAQMQAAAQLNEPQ